MMTMNSKKSYVMFSSMATTRTTSTEKCVSISNKWLEALKMGLSHDQWTQWAILKRKNPNSQFRSWLLWRLIEFLIPNSFSMIFPVFFGSILLAHCAAGGGWSSYSVRSSTRGGRRTERGAEKPNWRSMAATAPRFFLQVVSLLSLFVSFAKWTSEIHWFAKKKYWNYQYLAVCVLLFFMRAMFSLMTWKNIHQDHE